MPLVAYDASDDEDSQDEEDQPKELSSAVKLTNDTIQKQSNVAGKFINQPDGSKDLPIIMNNGDEAYYDQVKVVNDRDEGIEADGPSKLLERLPGANKKLPLSSTVTTGLSDIVVVDKKTKKIKVFIPSLDDMDYDSDDSEEEVGPKRKIAPAGGCSLTSFLPKPRNAPPRFGSSIFSSISSSISPSPSSSTPSASVVSSVASLVPHSVSRQKNKVPPLKRPASLMETDEDSSSIKFFSFDDSPPPSDSSEVQIDSNNDKIIPTVNTKPETDLSFNEMMMRRIGQEDDKIEEFNCPSTSSHFYDQRQEALTNSDQAPSTLDINDPQYKKFIAAKFGEESADDIQIVNVDVKSYLASESELIRSLSMEQAPSSVKGPAPSALAKRKNQIVYLAFQAKQRELDLKNQASNNRFTKAQTRAKYGF